MNNKTVNLINVVYPNNNLFNKVHKIYGKIQLKQYILNFIN
mgnify:CR=1 FL=1